MIQNNLKYLLFFTIGLITSFTVNKCTKTQNVVEVVIPKKEGVFTKTDTVYKTNIKTKFVYQKDTIELENPVNKQLAEEYIKQTDSIEKLKKYLKAIEEKEEVHLFNNKDLKIEIATKTRGEILKIIPTYTIHPQKIEVPQKKTVFAIYTGGEIFNNLDGSGLGIKLNLGVQNNKGILFTGGVDNDKNIYLGTSIRILNIEK